ncbi:nSTAND1 domain-containing NTPase [Leptothoe kymatousa]|uniref:Caspase family protein n=1 Tax=Leptothoe kymatousa TAU-MAC 1615 TaxID=2364775 RepID=A0ABS5Y679_9CYAN|nr:caspase family protein [Leptothoe kymatousa]MBT9313327.1 caspase family protein [Leptothoe kymatousa TAU-MAC 1615]
MSRDALIVGINQYQYLPKLTAAAKDAEGMASLLESHGNFRVRRLPEIIDHQRPTVGQNTSVSLQQLEASLVRLLIPKGDHIPEAVFFYFSGHGLQRDVGIREGFLATSDTQVDTSNSGLSLSWLRRIIRHSPIRQIVVILDCCHSGEFLALKEDSWQGSDGQSYLFIAASREYEEAYESLEGDYSVLTQAVLSGLSPQQSDSNRVTSTDLIASITKQLSNEIQQPLFEQGGSEIVITQKTDNNLVETDNSSVISRLKKYSLNFCPYRGFQPFEEKHTDYYFGREPLIQAVLQKLQQQNICVLVGASGSGKTSLLRAGVMARLASGQDIAGSENWIVRYLTPGQRPLKNLAKAFATETPGIDVASQLSQADELLRQEPNGLMHLVNGALLKQPGTSKFWLVIDQFEELLTPTTDPHLQAEQQQTLELLLQAMTCPATSLGLVIGLRSDALDALTLHKTLFSLVEHHRVVLTPMTYQEIRDVIEKPAAKMGLALDPYLVHHLTLDLTGAPGELALLQSILQELWRQRKAHPLKQENPCLSLDSYLKLGRLSQILVQRATDCYDTLSADEQPVAQRIFLTLCDLGEGRLDQSRRARKCELVNRQFPKAMVDQVLAKLIAARLVVTNKISAVPQGEGQGIATAAWETRDSDTATVKRWLVANWPKPQTTDETIELAHNSLVSDWPLLRAWLHCDRTLLKQQRDIEERAWVWQDRGAPKGSDYLLSQQYLRKSRDFLRGHRSDLSTLAQTFVETSQRAATFALWQSRSVAVLLPLAMMAGMTVSLARQPDIAPDSIDIQALYPVVPANVGSAGIDRLTVTSKILAFHQQHPTSALSKVSITQLADLMTHQVIATQISQ